ncbi:Hypothetical predicted protein [Paramuricea clavata]|uniref:Uncharacterized protein n=1 Tax=Paramuricea clavata TaxID=317549 RepID=A0A6S7HMG1_PARCT|nr:Hypothetical predicted protein [Paramuricea clavata]
MLVVPQLSWPILFGENHLHSTKALVDHAVPSIGFRHPSMQFMIKCSLENPQQAFQNSTPRPHAGVTCQLTGGSSVGTHKSKPTMLHRDDITAFINSRTTRARTTPARTTPARTTRARTTPARTTPVRTREQHQREQHQREQHQREQHQREQHQQEQEHHQQKQLQEARKIIARLGKLRGIVTKCPYLSLEGGAAGGTYYLKLDMNIFSQVFTIPI